MRVKADDLPVLPGALDFIDMGIIPEGTYTNQKFYRQWVSSTLNEADPLDILGFDPQTSGGLLFSLPPAGAERLLAELAGQTGTIGGWIIRDVVAGDKGSIQLV